MEFQKNCWRIQKRPKAQSNKAPQCRTTQCIKAPAQDLEKDPNLTLGMHNHCDPNLFTILYQGNVYGLQILKDGKWIGVEPLPNAFLVFIGCQLQIISNGKLKSVIHQAVTNSKQARISVCTFVIPSSDCHIEPASHLVNESTKIPLYKGYQYKEFLHTYILNHGDFEAVLQFYKL
ncbi:hypothetical protein BC332_17590 [Capsicum chinense]|nr:hypothetical protein BC332_17590 [Capsicum chinense]